MRVPVLLFSSAALLLGSVLLAQTASSTRPHGNVAHRHQAVRPAPLSPEEQAEQVVARFTFGPTPGMVHTVAAEGWQAWFAQQLKPETIPDAALQQRLATYLSLTMSPASLAVQFPDGGVIRRIANGKQPMPADPQLAAVYEVMVARYQEKERERAEPAAAGAPTPVAAAGAPAQSQDDDGMSKGSRQARALTLAGPILALPASARLHAVLALPVADRMALTRGLQDPLRTQLLQGVPQQDHELWSVMAGGYGANGVAANELEQAKILRAVLSQRQLQEVMTDFWVNHFNIDLGKSGDEIDYAGQFEQQAIRPHALGKFRDLLLATAHSPAMLVYLDNQTSIGADSPAADRQKKNGTHGGLNENYGREVMELHTLGVDGGYTQADVTELANIMTGWGVDKPQEGGPFQFEQRRHEPGTKQWLAQTIQQGGEQEGVQALSYLAAQPATARHVSFELAQRFVSDTPPPALVDRMTAAWLSSDGDITQVLEAMVHSPEFFDRANFRTKVKSPLEFVASAMRSTSADPTNPAALVSQLRLMGEPLYRCLPPTGYPSTSAQWMNSTALIDRLNFALALSAGKLGGMHLDAPLLVATGLMEHSPQAASIEKSQGRLTARTNTVAFVHPADAIPADAHAGSDAALTLMEQALMAGPLSAQTSSIIQAQLAQRAQDAEPANPAATLDTMAALILGSPEFQVH